MHTLGITGGIGTGKTAVCRLFEALGAQVFYADAESKRILAEDASARAEIVAAFGAESYAEDGALNRRYLAERVFGDAEQLARINAIVHPRVRQAFADTRARAEANGVPLLVYEAALIYETGGEAHLDAVAVVEAPEAVRIARVVARDGVTPEQVRARMQHQLPPATLHARADYHLDNSGDQAALRPQVEALFHRLTGTR
ncbi:MAG: dephospho-CoA kinase [Bacteroidota bacterium]